MMKLEDEENKIKGLIFNYFIQNQTKLKRLLIPLATEAGKEILSDDILNKEWLDRVKWIIVSDMCLGLGLSVDPVIEFVENINLKEMIKAV